MAGTSAARTLIATKTMDAARNGMAVTFQIFFE
jgi:hypothetical protein